jgi:membrane protein DedA with SNARE-associated domain
VTVAAATLADVSWFLLGRRWGARVLRFVGRVSGAANRRARSRQPADTSGAFARWGPRALVIAKFLPGVSQLIVPMSGATGVSFRSFLFYDLVGTLVWAAVPIGSGMIFHEQVDGILVAMSRVGVWLLLALAIGTVGIIAWRLASRAVAPN